MPDSKANLEIAIFDALHQKSTEFQIAGRCADRLIGFIYV
jgi:hypothetical protein